MECEAERLRAMRRYEDELHRQGHTLVAGVDEAGRGPLAGPVVAAAVVLPPGLVLAGVDDSKRLSVRQREQLEQDIKREALAWAIGMVFPPLLDRLNVLNASREAMRLALQGLALRPQHVITDAVRLTGLEVGQTPLVRGDSLSISVACASILAKVERDRVMAAADGLFPGYGFGAHKGYGTREHLRALHQLGPCPLHRLSFAPVAAVWREESNGHQGRLF